MSKETIKQARILPVGWTENKAFIKKKQDTLV